MALVCNICFYNYYLASQTNFFFLVFFPLSFIMYLLCMHISFILLHDLISFLSIVKTNGSCDGNVVVNGEVDGIRNRAKKES